MTLRQANGSLRWDVILAFASVYIIWGSTYLAIRVAIESIPPLLMLGSRFGVAGGLMYVWLRASGVPAPSRRQWGGATLLGGMMLFVGTGCVAWAEQYIPSGVAALLVTSVPLWMALLDWLWKGGDRPGLPVFFGFALGFAGVALLIDPASVAEGLSGEILAAFIVLVGSISWSTASIHARDIDLPKHPFLATAMQMFAGGALLTLTGLLMGEGQHMDVALWSMRSFFGWIYLVVFGSFIAFSAYVWLLRQASPAAVSTYALVNPVVAVFLGWALLSEPLNLRVGGAMLLLITAVVLITRRKMQGTRLQNVVDAPRPQDAYTRFTPVRLHSCREIGIPETALREVDGKEL